jgi:CheY-like chemotaxis protein
MTLPLTRFPKQSNKSSVKSRKCLFIDDDEDDQEAFLAVVRKVSSSIECVIAANGQIGIDKLVDDRLQPELIFLDLNMPVMNGIQFLEEFKNHPEVERIPIVIWSHLLPKSVTIPTGIDIKYFVTKPNTIGEWKEKISYILFDQLALPI